MPASHGSDGDSIMSISLNATLKARYDQTTIDLNPILKVTSHNPVNSIPFVGYGLSSLSAEREGKLIYHSSGRLVYVYIYNGQPRLGYSDVDRTQWYNNNALNTDGNYTCTSIDAVEMPDGNIAIVTVLAYNSGTAQYVQGQISTVTGTLVRGRITAFNWGSGEWDYGISLSYNALEAKYRWVLATYTGSSYTFRTGTSSDWTTFDTSYYFTPTGLSASFPYGRPYLFYPENDNPVLVFDYVEEYGSTGDPLKNIYIMESLDGGTTWEAPTAVTNYTTFGTIAYQPALSQSVENQLLLTYIEETPSLYMPRTTPGWSPDDSEGFAYTLAWDPVRRKIYYSVNQEWPVAHLLKGVTQIDMDSWTPDDYWDTSSTPYLSDASNMAEKNFNATFHDGKFYQMRANGTILAIDPVTNSLTWYIFTQSPGYWNHYQDKNVNSLWSSAYGVANFHVDKTNNRLIIFWSDGTTFDYYTNYSYLDLSQTGPVYTQVDMGAGSRYGSGWWSYYGTYGAYMRAFPEYGWIVQWNTDFGGGDMITVWVLDDNYQVQFYEQMGWSSTSDDATIGWSDMNVTMSGGINDLCIVGDIMFIIDQTQGYIQRLDLNSLWSEKITPPYAMSNIRNCVYEPELDALLLSSTSFGLQVYYLGTNEWVVYNNSTIPGITPSGKNQFNRAFYDSVTDGFVCGVTDQYIDSQNDDGGIVFIPRDGKIRQAQYSTGTENVGWTFDTPAKLVEDFSVEDLTTAYLPGSNEFYALWSNFTPADGTYKLTWDKNESSADITKYIKDDSKVIWKRSILGDPCSFTFELAPGHLFDPWNQSSLIAKYVQKGRRLELYAGENISGTPYYQAQGVYYIQSTKRTYKKGNMTITKIHAVDKLEQLKANEIKATEYLSNVSAVNAFKEIAAVYGAVDSTLDVVSLPFIGDKTISPQFVDLDLYEILYTIAWRFGTMPRYTMTGKMDTRLVPASAVSHTYTNSNKIFDFTPNDDYSDLTNDVTVHGKLDSLTQVLYEEEMIAQINGTVGWWGEPETYTIWFSEDHQKVVKNLRLEVISSAESIAFQLAGGVSEEISYEDPNGKYCKVKVDAPNLIPALAVAIGAYIFATNTPDTWFGFGSGPTVAVGRRIEGLSLFVAFQILGSIATFQYEIWGQPEGYVRRSVQNPALSASDAEHIAYMGQIFNREIDGWKTNSANECLAVAKRELEIVKMQRRRVEFSKVAHLQDEEGDRISVLHPDTNNALDVNIITLERTFIKGKKGSFKDKIEGWVKT